MTVLLANHSWGQGIDGEIVEVNCIRYIPLQFVVNSTIPIIYLYKPKLRWGDQYEIGGRQLLT